MKIIITALKIIIFLVIWVIQMTILIYFTMEFYGELRPNPSIAIGGLTSLYLSYLFVKKLNISKFLISFKRSHKKESSKINTTELTIEKSKSKILYMPKKIFYIISTLCLIVIISISIYGYINVSDREAYREYQEASGKPYSKNFDFWTDVTSTDGTVAVDGLRYNMDDMTLFTGVYRFGYRKIKSDIFNDVNYQYEYLKGKRHGYYYSWIKEGYLARGNYREGEKHGLFEEWYENGQLKSRGNYSNGEIIGELERWAIDGKSIL